MTDLTEQLDQLIERIGSADPCKRHEYQPELCALIDRMREAGLPVPCETLSLRDELVSEAIEAQFDNMPV